MFGKLKKRVEDYRLDKITEEKLNQSFQSYLGALSHADTYKLSKKLKNEMWWG